MQLYSLTLLPLSTDKHSMTLDLTIPTLALIYGATISLALHLLKRPGFIFKRMDSPISTHNLHAKLETRRKLALFCLVLGTLWTLQNLLG